MLFNSYGFIFIFLPITLAAYYVLGRRRPDFAKLALLAASLVFYAISPAANLPLMLASILGNWLLSRIIVDHGRPAHWRDLAVKIGVVANLSALFFFKYAEFARGLIEGNLDSSTPAEVIPLGISFFTFTQIAFLVDARREPIAPPTGLDYAVFVTVFPHLVAGPIIHHKQVMPRLARPETFRIDSDLLAKGLVLFAIGLLKKAMFADSVAEYADQVFKATSPTFLEAWGGVLAYTFQIYFDFSGYSDMAVGLGLMLGLRLPINFASPYQADSIIEFWRRWHISLSRFLRDYLYIPLGGNRRGALRRYLNLTLTMALGGLWHGASLTFLAWGGVHALALIANHGWRWLRRGNPAGGCGPCRLAGRGLTFLTVVVAWVFFRAPSLGAALDILSGMAGLNGIVIPDSYAGHPVFADLIGLGLPSRYLPNFFGSPQVAWVGALALIAFTQPNSQSIVLAGTCREWLRFRPSRRWVVGASLLLVGGLVGISKSAPFLYFQF